MMLVTCYKSSSARTRRCGRRREQAANEQNARSPKDATNGLVTWQSGSHVGLELLGEKSKVPGMDPAGLCYSIRTTSTCDTMLPARSDSQIDDTNEAIDTGWEPCIDPINSATANPTRRRPNPEF